MKTEWTKEKLDKFSEEIATLFNEGKIKFPIHLCGGKNQAESLIKIFSDFNKGDWAFSTWRNSWHWLLSGRSAKKIKHQIMTYGSMNVFDKKFFTSAIVGGIAPIAVGVAWALKKKKSKNKVFCFLGDMGARCGISLEAINFSRGHDLPIIFVIEDNGKSVYTMTKDVWGKGKKKKVIKYNYRKKYRHHGSGLDTKENQVLF